MVKIYGIEPDPRSALTRIKKVGERSEKMVWDLLDKVDMPGAKAVRGFTGFSVGRQASSEADFVVWTTDGVFVLEVKTQDDRNRKRGWDQASDNAHGLKKKLSRVIGCDVADKSLMPSVGWGVIYTEHLGSELNKLSGAVQDLDSLRGSEILDDPNGFSDWIQSRINNAQGSLSSHKKFWSNNEIEEYSKKMAGEQRLKRNLHAFDERIERFTEEQASTYVNVSKYIQKQIILGGAGTGKTVVALMSAQEFASENEVAILTSTSLQKNYLESRISDHKSKISVMTPAQFLKAASDGLGPWDVLIVDEGQDLLSEDVIYSIDSVLKGGLDKGRWYWFMDLANQTGVYGSVSHSSYELLLGHLSAGVSPLELQKNMRNSQNVSEFVREQLNARVGDGSDIAGGDVGINWETSRENYVENCRSWIDEELNRFTDEYDGKVFIVDISRSDSELADGDWFFTKEIRPFLRKSVKKRIKSHNHQTFQGDAMVLATNPQRVKGLESTHCLVIGDPGLDENDPIDRQFIAGGMYVAMTRARHSVSFYLPKDWATIKLERLEDVIDQ